MENTQVTSTAVKLHKLKEILQQLGSGLVAYSGGVDSTFLVQVAYEVWGNRCLAVTASSETYPEGELRDALAAIEAIGAPHRLILSKELANEQFVSNPPEKCYFCKLERFSKLLDIAREENLQCVLDGANADDVQDYRPGMRASRELGVRSPLQEVGLTKQEIRQLSQERGLPTWDKPSSACLASRIPYGQRITVAKLNQIAQAETFLSEFGLTQFRVRHHENIARLEVPAQEIVRVAGELRAAVVKRFKELGFAYVTLDLQGFRSGSMNEVLGQQEG